MDLFKTRLFISTALALVPIAALAASSGNFAGTVSNQNCIIDSGTGVQTGGQTSGSAGTVFPISTTPIQIQVASGSGTALVITPSAVTGLYTDNKLSTSGNSTEDVGIQMQVNISAAPGTALKGPIQIAPSTTGDVANATDSGATCVDPASGVASCVIYDQHFIQISSTALQQLAAAGGIAAGTTLFEQIQSTLSAHAFNFYVQVPNGGTYNVTAQGQLFVGKGNSTNGSIAGCFGPATLTVQQVQNFNFNTPLQF